MKLSGHLIVSNPERESEWRQILERRLKSPALYVICIPEDRRYPAEIVSSAVYYRNEDRLRVIGIADSEGACRKLFAQVVETVLPTDPELKNLRSRLRENYL